MQRSGQGSLAEPSSIRSPPHGSASSGWALPFPWDPEVPLPPSRLQVTPLSRVLGRRAAKGGAPANPPRTCYALSSLRREYRAPSPEASQSGHTPNLPPHPQLHRPLGWAPPVNSRKGSKKSWDWEKLSRQPRMQMLRRYSTSALCKGRAGTQEWDFLKHCTQGTLLASSSLVLALEERHSSTQRPHKALYPNNPNHKTETQQPAVGR